MHLRLPAFLALATASFAPAQRTFVVGPGGFREIQPAIDAAADGDRIVVRAGSYGAAQPLVVNKGVTITCEDPTYISSGVRFAGVLPGQQASIANAQLTGGELPGVRTLSVVEALDCGGVVAVIRCGLFAGATAGTGGRLIYASDPVVRCHRSTLVLTGIYLHGGYGTPVIEAQSSTVHMSTCLGARSSAPFYLDLATGRFLYNGPVPPAMRVTDCQVSMSDTFLSGGEGKSALYAAGGDALQATRGELHLARVMGSGGAGFDDPGGPGGAGGNGIVHTAMAAAGLTVSIQPGRGGAGVPPGARGAAIVGPNIPLEALPSLFSGTSVVQPGGPVRLDATVVPGSYLFWMVGLPGGALAVPGIGGRLVPRFDGPLFVLGPVYAANGTAILTFGVPADPSFTGLNVAAQTAGIDAVRLSVFLSTSALVAVGR